MKKIIGFSLIASSILALSGCAHAFRNRAYDYTTVDVQQLPPLQVPAGVTSPKPQPALTVPPGQTNYLPSGMPVMTPPYYNDTYKVNDKAKQATLITSPGLVSSSQAASSSSLSAASTVKPKVAGKVASGALAAQAANKSSLNLPSQIVRTKNNTPVLEITAPFDITWAQMPSALQKSGYRIVNSEQANGYYFIALQGDNNNADAVLLYLKQNQNVTQVLLYNSAGNPDSSNNAYLTLQQLAKNL
ncbi:MAG: NlpB/DapX lipoprotein [Gammaproteobacteria bacterium]|nr:NlpB/DapX lipoprotein [Gammaproteobacteria bacterium]